MNYCNILTSYIIENILLLIKANGQKKDAKSTKVIIKGQFASATI